MKGRTKNLASEFGTVAINSLALQKSKAGVKVYNLSAGEPKLPPHPIIAKAIAKALKQGKIFYPPFSGISELKHAAADWMNNFYNANFRPENTLVVNGGKFGLYLLLQSLLKKGDEVLIPAPFWVSYPAIAGLFGGKSVFIKTTEAGGWKISGGDVIKQANKKTKILILNSACNPTGALYSKNELEEILIAAKKKKLLVISDEVYSGLVYDRQSYVSCATFPKFKDSLVIIQSCSKNFAMTGLRVGFVFGPKAIISRLGWLVSQSTSGVTTLSQWAALAAFKNARGIIRQTNSAMRQRRDAFLRSFFRHFGVLLKKPVSALYFFVSLADLGATAVDSVKFCKDALERANVALVPGKIFGLEGYVRFAFGAPEREIEQALKILAKFCKKFK